MHNTSQETVDLILKLRSEGKTYDDIRQVTGCAKATISKYCMQAGLSEDPKKIDELTPEFIEEAQKQYDKLKNIKKVAKNLKVSYKRLVKAGVKLDQEKNKQKNKNQTPQATCAQKTKLKAIAYKGSKCLVCGYNRSIRVLQFHHIDPKSKEFGISGSTKSFEKLKPELDKCVLLCSNCHGEVHDGLIDLTQYL